MATFIVTCTLGGGFTSPPFIMEHDDKTYEQFVADFKRSTKRVKKALNMPARNFDEKVPEQAALLNAVTNDLVFRKGYRYRDAQNAAVSVSSWEAYLDRRRR